MEQNIEMKTEKRPFGKRDIIGYFFGDFGCNMSFTVQAMYLFVFYTQYIGISLEHWAVIILVAKLFDGINDPIAGHIIDKVAARTTGDKFKPWIKYGAPILAFVPMLMFIDSSGWSYAARIVICFVTYLAWDLAYTVVNVPYGALSSVMTDSSVERTKLSTVRSWGGILPAVLIGAILPGILYENRVIDGNTVSVFVGEYMFIIAAVLGVVALGSFAMLYFNVEERVVTEVQYDKDGEVVEVSMFETIKNLAKNRPFWGLIVAAVGQLLFMGGQGQLNQMTFQMYFGDGSLTAYTSFMMLAPMIFGSIFGTALVKRYGTSKVTAYPMLVSIILFVIALTVRITNPYIYIALLFVSQTLGFGQMLYVWAMMSDVIDYQEYISGSRNEGSVYALYSMGRKIMQGFSSSVVPFAITLIAPSLLVNDPTTWTASSNISIYNLALTFGIIGFSFVFVGIGLIYNLDQEKNEEVSTELKRRRNISTASPSEDPELEGALGTTEPV